MAKTKKVVRTRRRERKNVVNGQAHIQSTFNNTIISISDIDGNVISWGSAGAQGFKGSRKSTPYGVQLRAKQKARRIYGLLEKQFRNYFDQATREPGVTGVNLLRHLELRLDNVVYRLGLGTSRKQARQLVSHRHFEVNGHTVNVPSYHLKPGEALKVKPANGVIDVALEASKVRPVPSWLSFNGEDKTGKILARPDRQEMESGVEEQLIVEFYSR